MSLIITQSKMPPTSWIQDAVHSEFTGHGWGPIGIVVDDESSDAVVVHVLLPEQVNREGATAGSRFNIDPNTVATREQIEHMIKRAAKKAVRSLAMQISAEKGRPLDG